LSDLGLQIFKIPSGEITNLPYLRHVGSLGKRVILSTGMSDLSEVRDALNILINTKTSKDNITVLHANTMYPTPMEDVNLNAMLTMQKEFGVSIGYSDHTLGIEVDIAAVAMGASVIEKHFTLDKFMKGPDHQASLEPQELRAMVDAIRNTEKALGSSIKEPSSSESININIARKSIVASQSIKKGEKLSSENITTKRPGTGISPMEWDEIIGTFAKKNYRMDDLI
jgi:N,N'-diacetyllegionaminate synthase